MQNIIHTTKNRKVLCLRILSQDLVYFRFVFISMLSNHALINDFDITPPALFNLPGKLFAVSNGAHSKAVTEKDPLILAKRGTN